MPEAVTFTQARQNWAALLDRVTADYNPLIITRYKAKPVVVMVLEDYKAIRCISCRLLFPSDITELWEKCADGKRLGKGEVNHCGHD